MTPITTVLSKFLTAATVAAVVDHDGPFRTITLQPAKKADWVPGDRVRIAATGLTLRAYTPLAVDPGSGAITILAHVAGTGPGSHWCAAATVGQEVRIQGLQRSVRLDRAAAAQPVVVGDETALGLYLAQRACYPDAPTGIFEVDAVPQVRAVLARHGASGATLVPKQAGDGHLGQLAAAVLDALRTSPDLGLCLAGRAQTIAALRRRLKEEGQAKRATLVKAYWDVKRAGLE